MSVSVLPLPSHSRRFNRVLWSPLNGVSMADSFVLRASCWADFPMGLLTMQLYIFFWFLFITLTMREQALLTL